MPRVDRPGENKVHNDKGFGARISAVRTRATDERKKSNLADWLWIKRKEQEYAISLLVADEDECSFDMPRHMSI